MKTFFMRNMRKKKSSISLDYKIKEQLGANLGITVPTNAV